MVQKTYQVMEGGGADGRRVFESYALPCWICHPTRQERRATIRQLYHEMELTVKVLTAVRYDALAEKWVMTIPHHHWYMGRMLPARRVWARHT